MIKTRNHNEIVQLNERGKFKCDSTDNCNMKDHPTYRVKRVMSPRAQFYQRFTYSFYVCRSQKRNKDSQVLIFFTPLGSTSVKAVHKTLVKLTTGLFFREPWP